MFNEMMPMSIGGDGGINKIAIGTLQYNDPRWTGSGANSECPIEVGFKPTHIIWYFESNSNSWPFMSIYNVELKNDKFFGSTLIGASSGNNWQWIDNGRKSGQNPWLLGLQTVDSNGFTIGYKDYQDWSSYTLKWIALQINE